MRCLHLASNAREPQHGQCANSGEQTALVVVSLCATLATFALTMVGAGSVLAGLRVVATRISAAGATVARARGASVAGHASQAVTVLIESKCTETAIG